MHRGKGYLVMASVFITLAMMQAVLADQDIISLENIVIELEGGEEVDLLEAGSSSYPNSNDKE